MLRVSGRLDLSVVYSLCVNAGDGQHNSTVTFNVTVTRPDDRRHVVEFSQPFYVFDVPEDAPLGVSVGLVEALVDVIGHRAESSPPSYAVASRWASSVFHINATYGILTLAGSLDYETVSL